jgi:hypothetical protein
MGQERHNEAVVSALSKAKGLSAQPEKPLPFKIIDFLSGGLTDPDQWRDSSQWTSNVINTLNTAGGAVLGGITGMANKAVTRALTPRPTPPPPRPLPPEYGQLKALLEESDRRRRMSPEETLMAQFDGVGQHPEEKAQRLIEGLMAKGDVDPRVMELYTKEKRVGPGHYLYPDTLYGKKSTNYVPASASELPYVPTPIQQAELLSDWKNRPAEATIRVLSQRPLSRRGFFDTVGKLRRDMLLDRSDRLDKASILEAEKAESFTREMDEAHSRGWLDGFDMENPEHRAEVERFWAEHDAASAKGAVHEQLADQYYDEAKDAGRQAWEDPLLDRIRRAVNAPTEAVKTATKVVKDPVSPEARRAFLKWISGQGKK